MKTVVFGDYKALILNQFGEATTSTQSIHYIANHFDVSNIFVWKLFEIILFTNFYRTFTSVTVNILTCSQCIFLDVCYRNVSPNISAIPLPPLSNLGDSEIISTLWKGIWRENQTQCQKTWHWSDFHKRTNFETETLNTQRKEIRKTRSCL